MKSYRNKFVALALAGAIFAGSSIAAPKRSEAALGLLVATLGANPGASVVFFLGAVGSGTGAVHFFRKGWSASGGRAFLNYLLSAACAFGAYILLDGSGTRSGELKSMTLEDARKIQLTEAEWRAYEAELPMVNALREEAIARTHADLAQFEVRSDSDLEKVVLQLRAHWQSLSEGMLAPETHSVIRKLGHTAVTR